MDNIKEAHWKQKWSMPLTPSWTITGFSRAAYRTGFYIPELDIMLDAGPLIFRHPTNIFITHTHGDHIANLPLSFLGYEQKDNQLIQMYGPKQAENYLRNYISCLLEVNTLKPKEERVNNEWYYYNGFEIHTLFRTILRKTKFEIEVILCDHSIPTISYGFSLIKQKLKEEYQGMKSKEIVTLRNSGIEITQEVIEKKFIFICDTSISIFTTYPQILFYPIIFIECTFLYPEEIENAIQTKHIHWRDLEPFVACNPNVLFVLIHFSLRYKEQEIIDFFREIKRRARNENENENIYENIKLWVGDTRRCWWDESYVLNDDSNIETILKGEEGIENIGKSQRCSCNCHENSNFNNESNRNNDSNNKSYSRNSNRNNINSLNRVEDQIP